VVQRSHGNSGGWRIPAGCAMVLRNQAEGNRTRIEGECVLRGHSELEALGGGLFEEMVQTPLGKCSINTH
jgi:hypothetical protein